MPRRLPSNVVVFCAVRMTGPPVKLVRQRLDAAGVVAYVADLVTRATQLEVRTKDDLSQMSDATVEPLAALADRLVAGELAGLQIRFFADDDWWSDTVLRARAGFLLVRMREGA